MRLRLKQQGSAQRILLELPEKKASFAQLLAAVARDVFQAPDKAEDVRLSFNNRDILTGGPDTALADLGIRNGDLLWLLAPPLTPAEPPAPPAEERTDCTNAGSKSVRSQGVHGLPEVQQAGEQESQPEQRRAGAALEAAAGGASQAGGEGEQAVPPSHRVPACLLRTLQYNYTQQSQPVELLICAAHAAMLETGFVPTPDSTSTGCSVYEIPRNAWSSNSICRLSYHLSLSGTKVGHSDSQEQQQQQAGCMLHCSSLGKDAVLLAAATQAHSCHLCLQAAEFVGPHSLLGGEACSPQLQDPDRGARGKWGQGVGGGVGPASQPGLHPGATRRLWTRLKDALTFPLLLAACAEAGLPPPAGLMALPDDLKYRLLGLLPAHDLATLCCTCRELRHLASADELWHPLFDRDFPQAPHWCRQRAEERQDWKWAYGQCSRERRQREEALRRARTPRFMPALPRFGPRPPFYPVPPPPGFPHIIGGNYDRLPQLGLSSGPPGNALGSAPGGLFFQSGRRQGRGGLGGFSIH